MQIFRYAEQGSIKFLWISGTNPAVSLPELGAHPLHPRAGSLFVVAQDIFLTETAHARRRRAARRHLGREDRRVHQRRPHRAPVREGRRTARRGSSRSRHLPGLRRPHGLPRQGRAPLVHWPDPESAFEAWKRCSAGRPCDYTGITYDLLRGPQRHPVAVHRSEHPAAPNASTPTATSGPHPTSARATDGT